MCVSVVCMHVYMCACDGMLCVSAYVFVSLHDKCVPTP